jgi:hypothetical protein
MLIELLRNLKSLIIYEKQLLTKTSDFFVLNINYRVCELNTINKRRKLEEQSW